MIKAGLFLTTANILGALLSLLRNVLVARLISVDNFGIASTFAVIMTLVDATLNFALDRLIVQAKDGESVLLQSTVQMLQATRGTAGAAVLFLTAGPIASLFGVPQLAWTYQALSLIPFLRGLAHLDMFRMQRKMRFLPSITVEFASQVCSTVAAVVLALKLGDYRAMLYALLLQQLSYTAASHVVAVRPYRWAWDRLVVQRALVFGWPLFLNGILIFGIFQGDRIVVGSLLGMTELGWFSVAFSLTLMPTMIVAGTLQSFFLPQLSQTQDNAEKFYPLYLVSTQAAIFAGLTLAVIFSLVGPLLLLGLFGVKYEAALTVLVWLAVMQALRIAKAGPAIVALSRAETHNPLIANITRALMLPIAWALVRQGAGVLTVVATGILGEGLAFSVSLYLLNRRLSLPLSDLSFGLVMGCITLLLIGFETYMWPPAAFMIQNLHFFQITLVLALLLTWWLMPALRQWVKFLFLGNVCERRNTDT
jgi:O-antigen/teichoic acid export membrane protein